MSGEKQLRASGTIPIEQDTVMDESLVHTDVTRLRQRSLNGTIDQNSRGAKGACDDGCVPFNEPLRIVGERSDDSNAGEGGDEGRE